MSPRFTWAREPLTCTLCGYLRPAAFCAENGFAICVPCIMALHRAMEQRDRDWARGLTPEQRESISTAYPTLVSDERHHQVMVERGLA